MLPLLPACSRSLLWMWLPLVMAGCGGGGGSYAGTWEGSCELETEIWQLDLTLEKSEGEPGGQAFVIIDAFGYERYYSGALEGELDGDALSLESEVIPTDNPDGEARDLTLEVVIEGEEMSGDCSGDGVDGVVSLERE